MVPGKRRWRCASLDMRRSFLVLMALLLAAATLAQQAPAKALASLAQPGHGTIRLDVVVTTKSGSVVNGLSQRDFTILDNKVPQVITSFQAENGTQSATKVILVIDAVNVEYHKIGYERGQIDRFLRADGGNLLNPTAIFVLTDLGIRPVAQFSKDGNQLSAALDQYSIRLRFLRRGTGFYGAAERLQISVDAMHQMVSRERGLPGRKIMVWISPGWPVLSGPEVELDNKQRQQIFTDVVQLSTELRRERMTVYSIDPDGTFDSLGRDTYWQAFSGGIRKPSQANLGNLALQVLSTESGGDFFSFNNAITTLLQRCVRQTRAYYEISFQEPAGAGPDEYHRLQVRVAEHGLTAHTWQGYYSGPPSTYKRPRVPPPAGVRGIDALH